MWVNVELNIFKDAVNRYNSFVKKNKREPKYVAILGRKVALKDFKDAKLRLDRFIRLRKRHPHYVAVKLGDKVEGGEVEVRNPVLNPLRRYFGDFKTATEWYNKVCEKGDYDYYYNDVHSIETEVKRVTSGAGLNCVDWSQLSGAVMGALNKEGKRYTVTYVHVKCFSRNLNTYALGHVFLRVQGNELKEPTIMDFAAAANTGKPIGETMCSLGYKISSENPSWLHSETLK